jgi:hypothetical protein
MIPGPVFRSRGYHVLMASIYIAAGGVILYKSYTDPDSSNVKIIGWLLCAYGIFRLVSKLIALRKPLNEPKEEK